MNKLQTAIYFLMSIDTDATYGYEISKNLAERGLPWTHQQVYRELKKMSEQGFVDAHQKQQDGKPDRVIYKLKDFAVQPRDLYIDSDLALAFPENKAYRVSTAESVYVELIKIDGGSQIAKYKSKIYPIQLKMILDGISKDQAIKLGAGEKVDLIYKIVG